MLTLADLDAHSLYLPIGLNRLVYRIRDIDWNFTGRERLVFLPGARAAVGALARGDPAAAVALNAGSTIPAGVYSAVVVARTAAGGFSLPGGEGPARWP